MAQTQASKLPVAAGEPAAPQGWEPLIVGFLCNWCSYAGADSAGTGRMAQPTNVRIVRVPCSGRVNPRFILRAFARGADGVLVSGCHPGDCHYATGNFYARRRLMLLKRYLEYLGLDPRRLETHWVSASEGQKWAEVVRSMSETLKALGPAPRLGEWFGADLGLATETGPDEHPETGSNERPETGGQRDA